MVVFWCPQLAWHFQTPSHFPAVKTGIILKLEAVKTLTWLSSTSETHAGFYFRKKWTDEILQPGLEFDNFKPQLKSGIFNCISWLNCLFLREIIEAFWKSQYLSNDINVVSWLPNFFLSSHLSSMFCTRGPCPWDKLPNSTHFKEFICCINQRKEAVFNLIYLVFLDREWLFSCHLVAMSWFRCCSWQIALLTIFPFFFFLTTVNRMIMSLTAVRDLFTVSRAWLNGPFWGRWN
jgi:hypothetical protein